MRKHAMIWPVLITIAVLLYGCGQLPDERLMEKGKRMEENERFEEAVACYMELDEKYPDSPHRAEALYHAGRVYSYGMNDFKEAYVSCSRHMGAATEFFAEVFDTDEPDRITIFFTEKGNRLLGLGFLERHVVGIESLVLHYFFIYQGLNS